MPPRLSRFSIPASLLLACLVTLTSAIGCGGGDSPASTSVAMATSRLRLVVSLFTRVEIATGKRPANEQQFKEYIQQQGDAIYKDRGITSVDELLTSERDGQPFVILYGPPHKGVDKDVVAYEQTGVDGKRWVGFAIGQIEEIGEQRFRELVPADAEPK